MCGRCLIAELCDEDGNVRKYAAKTLAGLGEPQWEGLQWEKLAQGVPLAWEELGKSGDARLYDPLTTKLLMSPRANLRYCAVLALTALGDPKAVSSIRPLLQDPERHVRDAAVKAIASLGGAFSVDEMSLALRDENSSSVCEAVDIFRE